MHFLCEDLKKYGYKPIWFNAWHHQSEEQLLAALFSAIRDQAVPSWFSLGGIFFRIRLLWKRSAKRYLLALIACALMAAALLFVLNHDASDWQTVGNFLLQLFGAHGGDGKKNDVATATGALSSVGALMTLLVGAGAVYKKGKTFGADPAILLGTVSDAFDLKDAQALTNFRAQFAAQFHDVAETLDAPIVIVIDDLDRCKAEAVLNVMEGVNFLTSSGDCFVVFGMATNRVSAALSMSFEKIAVEMIDLDGDHSLGVDSETAIRDARRQYARDYLEKLVNIVIKVPERMDLPAHELLRAISESSTKRWKKFSATVMKLVPVAGIILAALVGGYLGREAPTPRVYAVTPTEKGPASKNAVVEPGKNASTKEAEKPGHQENPSIALTRTDWRADLSIPSSIPGIIGYIALVLTVVAASALLLFDRRKQIREVSDSPKFLAALEAWAPAVRQHRRTPRAMKRFGNRIRYLAMLQQPEGVDRSIASVFWERITARVRSRISFVHQSTPLAQTQEPAEDYGTLEDHRIVALGALYEILGPRWIRLFEHSESNPKAKLKLDGQFSDVIDLYKKNTGALWPPYANSARYHTMR